MGAFRAKQEEYCGCLARLMTSYAMLGRAGEGDLRMWEAELTFVPTAMAEIVAFLEVSLSY
jgi:hypothetical protein